MLISSNVGESTANGSNMVVCNISVSGTWQRPRIISET